MNGVVISWRSSRQGGVTLSISEAEFVSASQADQEVVYLREFLKDFGHPQKKPTEIWEDNSSCIMMSENPTNRDRSRHVDVKVHYLRDLVRDGHVKLVKCAGTQNVSDVLFQLRLRYFFSSIETKIAPVMAYSIKLPKFISFSNLSRKTKCAGG